MEVCRVTATPIRQNGSNFNPSWQGRRSSDESYGLVTTQDHWRKIEVTILFVLSDSHNLANWHNTFLSIFHKSRHYFNQLTVDVILDCCLSVFVKTRFCRIATGFRPVLLRRVAVRVYNLFIFLYVHSQFLLCQSIYMPYYLLFVNYFYGKQGLSKFLPKYFFSLCIGLILCPYTYIIPHF